MKIRKFVLLQLVDPLLYYTDDARSNTHQIYVYVLAYMFILRQDTYCMYSGISNEIFLFNISE